MSILEVAVSFRAEWESLSDIRYLEAGQGTMMSETGRIADVGSSAVLLQRPTFPEGLIPPSFARWT